MFGMLTECKPDIHYMIRLDSRLEQIRKRYVDRGKYFIGCGLSWRAVYRGNEYNERGEAQLAGYLDYFHRKKGYLISFNFNKKKNIGVKTITFDDKTIVEAVI